MRRTTRRTPVLTEAELMKPSPATCAQCGSACVHVPRKQPTTFRGDAAVFNAWQAEAAKVVCPHCSTLPRDQWPTWERGLVVKACGCGSATCPVPAWVAQRYANQMGVAHA